jgi:hypothetical protein
VNTTLNKIINHLAEKTNKLFLIDSLGAFLTAFFLFVFIRPYIEYFGMPKTILNNLSLTAIFFWVYSTTCLVFHKGLSPTFITIIGCANLLYCGWIALLIIKYLNQLSIIGVIYFFIELVIIICLSLIELKVASEVKKKRIEN